MKDYYAFQQLLYQLSSEALALMLDYESDAYKIRLLYDEIEARS